MSTPRSRGEHRELVDERDVHVPERVLEQLGELGLRGRRGRNDLVDQAPVERFHHGERLRADTGDDLGCVHEGVRRVARIDAFGGVAHEEVGLRVQATGFEDRPEQLLGRSGIRGRLEDDECAGSEEACEVVPGSFDVGEVGCPFGQRRLHGDDRDVEVAKIVDRTRGRIARAQGFAELCRGNVFDVRTSGAELVDAHRADVVAHDRKRDLGRAHRQREADVALADDHDLGRALLDARREPMQLRRRHGVPVSTVSTATGTSSRSRDTRTTRSASRPIANTWKAAKRMSSVFVVTRKSYLLRS